MTVWVTADKPNLPLFAAHYPSIERGYQENQVIDVIRGVPMIDRVSEIILKGTGELYDEGLTP